jgi:DNA ligase (NAD+)
LSGSTVSRATLHNQDRVSGLDIRVGDTITVRKAGDIIPEVVKVICHAENSRPFFIPERCPVCGTKAVRDTDEAVTRCPNIDCPAQLLRSIEHFASRGAMNIEGLGEAIVELLVSKGMINTVADLYRLSMQDLLTLPNFKEKSAGNLLSAIKKSKQSPLDKIIYALGIKGIGERNATLLAEKFSDIDGIMLAEQQEIADIFKFGDVLAANVFNAMREPHMVKLIKELRGLGLSMGYAKKQTSDKLSGLKFVITGTLPTLSRDEAKNLIIANGGNCSDSVSKKTSYLLAGKEAGSKLNKANDLKISVLSEKDLLEMIGSTG